MHAQNVSTYKMHAMGIAKNNLVQILIYLRSMEGARVGTFEFEGETALDPSQKNYYDNYL